ncbi:MAG: hypothetical protein J3K34DRAFT_397072 [Monoraphidium minutum]|nr:MAG: hypothetical protein J3K34DRAFT_397072 [Monoraphidium minutum]
MAARRRVRPPAARSSSRRAAAARPAAAPAPAGGPLIEPAPEAFDEFGDRLSALEERDAAAEEGRGGPAYDPFDADDYGPGGPGGGKGGGGGGAEGGGGGGAEGGGGEGALEGGAKGGGGRGPDPYYWDEESQLGKDTDWGWRDEMFDQGSHHVTSEFVYVDPHVLTTPAIADIDGDGHDELVLAVSYFFDKDYYDDPAHAGELGGDVQKDKYVAGGVAVFDLHSRTLKWSQHLDLTTDATTFKAHMFSSPTLADIDKDGKLEIIVGTSVGFLYVLDCWGSARPGWPLQMGEVQGQPLAADVNGDGWLEIFVGDSLGNVALFDREGKEIWERHVKSMIAQGAIAGDLDGDRRLDIVFGATDGSVHALRGFDGQPLPNFPYKTRGRCAARGGRGFLRGRVLPPYQHVAIMSFDGLLHVIDGSTGCGHTVDIGEASYAAVLVDDLDGAGELDLLVSTMNGNIFALGTASAYHPLKTWPAQVQYANGQVARSNYFGAFATPQSRVARDVAGQTMRLNIEIVDKRATLGPGGALVNASRGGPYNVTAILRGVGVAEMNAGDAPVIGVADVFATTGSHAIELPCPRTRTTATVRVELRDASGLLYIDEFALSFHVHFHKLLKYLITLSRLISIPGPIELRSHGDTMMGESAPSGTRKRRAVKHAKRNASAPLYSLLLPENLLSIYLLLDKPDRSSFRLTSRHCRGATAPLLRTPAALAAIKPQHLPAAARTFAAAPVTSVTLFGLDPITAPFTLTDTPQLAVALRSLAAFPGLTHLRAVALPRLLRAMGLAADAGGAPFCNLQRLELLCTGAAAGLPTLGSGLPENTPMRAIAALAPHLPRLRALRLVAPSAPRKGERLLQGLAALEELELGGVASCGNAAVLLASAPRRLAALALTDATRGVKDLSFLAAATHLTRLEVGREGPRGPWRGCLQRALGNRASAWAAVRQN